MATKMTVGPGTRRGFLLSKSIISMLKAGAFITHV